jgi:hypothetical protein
MISKLKKIVNNWGTLREVPPSVFYDYRYKRNFYRAPFTADLIGILWPKEIIYSGKVHWASIIHELGHAFATDKIPPISEEWNFFGWEYAMTKLINAPIKEWLAENKDYGIGVKGELNLGDLSYIEQISYCEDQFKFAQVKGLIDLVNNPLCMW